MNIYDLAGNVWEWTLEKIPSDSTPCALRGGYYGNYSAERPASYRYNATTAQAITTMVLASAFHFFSSQSDDELQQQRNKFKVIKYEQVGGRKVTLRL